MQKAPVMKGSGLIPLEDSKLKEEVHVFGKNLEERVITESEDSPSISFNKTPIEDDDNIESIRKRKFEAITGEEDEETIFQGDFKLFSWDLSTSNWIEKGRGHLKLNDSTTNENKKKSRLIMRVNGTLRIILNVAINRPLFRIILSTKDNIRFTDGQTVWAASGCYADQLNAMIEERMEKRQPEGEDDTTPSKKNKLESQVPFEKISLESPKPSKETNTESPSQTKDTDQTSSTSEETNEESRTLSKETKLESPTIKKTNLELSKIPKETKEESPTSSQENEVESTTPSKESEVESTTTSKDGVVESTTSKETNLKSPISKENEIESSSS